MTPEYASPEQVRGAAVTTSSDVYSLGVLLYELLTGQRPYAVRSDSLPEIVRVVCETEPPLPSKAARRTTGATAADLRGDLDIIVMKALHKEPARRYPSAQDLSTDIRRHLEGLPVLARPDTLGYRASKFVTRHRTGVGAAALVFVSLVGAVVITTRQARIAQRRFQETRRLANTLVYDTYAAISNVPGASEARAIVIKNGLEYLDRLAAESENDRDLLLELSTAYVKLGDAQGLPDQASLGDSRGALVSFQKALTIRERLSAEAPSDFVALYRVGIVHHRIGQILRETGDVRGALARHQKGLQIAEDSARGLGGDWAARRRILVAHCHLSAVFLLMGQAAEALDHARQGLAIATQLRKEDPKGSSGVYSAVELEADALVLQGDLERALPLFLAVLADAQEGLAADRTDPTARLGLAETQIKIAQMLGSMGRAKEAEPRVLEAVRAAEELVARDPHDLNGLSTLALAYMGYADLSKVTVPARAFDLYEKAQAALRQVTAGDPSNLKKQARLGTLLLHKGEAELAANRASAAQTLAEAETIARTLAAKDPAMREFQLLRARVQYRVGLSLASGSGGRCARLREAAAIWADLEKRGARAPQEAAEQRDVTTAAKACGSGLHPAR
jgi:eukaryotic-like serine/threonine-protein kinase